MLQGTRGEWPTSKNILSGALNSQTVPLKRIWQRQAAEVFAMNASWPCRDVREPASENKPTCVGEQASDPRCIEHCRSVAVTESSVFVHHIVRNIQIRANSLHVIMLINRFQ